MAPLDRHTTVLLSLVADLGGSMTMQACRLREPEYEIVLADEPGTDIVKDVLYVPESPDSPIPGIWGIFARDRRLVAGTGYFRGPGPHLPHQKYTTEIDYRNVRQQAPEPCYIYGGRIVPHFGHFLLGCFSRFWRQNELAGRKLKILVHSPHDVDTLFSHPHVTQMFGAIGLFPQDFVRFTESVRIQKLMVPLPSFEENHLAYSAFSRFCHEIGRRLIGRAPSSIDPRPVYLTKQRMTRGISRLVNEDELTNVLATNDVDIVSPELLDVPEQIRLLAGRDFISGSFGSIFHTSIFCPRRKLLMLNWGDTVFRNFTLIDAINENDSHYVFPKDDIEFCGDLGGFGANWRLRDPARTADQFLRVIEAFYGSRQPREGSPRNVSYRKPTLQSSYAGENPPFFIVGKSAGVDGRLSAGMGFSTAHEDCPWWQVDLERRVRITKIVIFNVVGPPLVTERAAKFRLLVSLDQSKWTEVLRRLDPQPFGGVDGSPFVWEPQSEVVGRFVRVQLLEPQFFHLDQVQVFGHLLSEEKISRGIFRNRMINRISTLARSVLRR